MKNRKLLIISGVFFLLVNTSYFWEGKLELWTFPAFMILFIVYLVLAGIAIHLLILSVREKFRQKPRNIALAVLVLVLFTTALWPTGIIDFNKWSGEDMLVASREGSANCTTSLRLKNDYSFRELIVCFGMSEVKGTYRVKADTIFFDNSSGRPGEPYYQFAVMTQQSYGSSKKFEVLEFYKDNNDTTRFTLWIKKNELYKLQQKAGR